MKTKSILLLILASILMFSSCQKQPKDEIVEQPEPQRMAYRLGEVSRVGDDIYFLSSSSFSDAQVFATEYGSENFDIFVPCFDAVCDHWNYPKCCISTYYNQTSLMQIYAFEYNGETALLLFNPVDICLSMLYSNVKTRLFCEDFVPLLETDFSASHEAYREWSRSEHERKKDVHNQGSSLPWL